MRPYYQERFYHLGPVDYRLAMDTSVGNTFTSWVVWIDRLNPGNPYGHDLDAKTEVFERHNLTQDQAIALVLDIEARFDAYLVETAL